MTGVTKSWRCASSKILQSLQTILRLKYWKLDPRSNLRSPKVDMNIGAFSYSKTLRRPRPDGIAKSQRRILNNLRPVQMGTFYLLGRLQAVYSIQNVPKGFPGNPRGWIQTL